MTSTAGASNKTAMNEAKEPEAAVMALAGGRDWTSQCSLRAQSLNDRANVAAHVPPPVRDRCTVKTPNNSLQANINTQFRCAKKITVRSVGRRRTQ